MRMRQTPCAAMFVTVWALSLVASAEPVADSEMTGEAIMAAQPDTSLKRLQQERVLLIEKSHEDARSPGSMTVAYVRFEHPPDHVFQFIAATHRQVEYRPELTAIQEIERHARGTTDEHHLRILFQRYAFRIRYRIDPKALRMDWELYPFEDGRTLGRSGARVDVGPAVPAFLQDWITRKNLPQSMEHVRQWVDSGGSDRP